MKQQTSHCLIHLNDQCNDSLSGVIFANKYVLTHARILKSLVLRSDKLVAENFELILQSLCTDDPKKGGQHIKIIVARDDRTELLALDGQIVNIFNCPNIRDFVSKLSNFSAGAFENDLDVYLLSRFVLLKIQDKSSDDQNEMLGFFREINKECNTQLPVRRADQIMTQSSPFGNECFFNTINYGQVSNVIGKEGSVLLLNVPLVYGAVGAGVYDTKFKLRGFVISTQIKWQQKNIDFSLAATLQEVLSALTKKELPTKNRQKCDIKSTMEDRIVLIRNGSSWATGSLVTIEGRRFIISCSHAITNDSSFECYWMQNKLKVDLVFRNPYHNRAYDIAIIAVHEENHIPEQYFSILSKRVPQIGQTIHSVGFPVFDVNSSVFSGNYSPFVCSGKVSKIKKGLMLTDCSVLEGQSGGPFYDEDGKIVGIAIANAKNEETGEIFPRVNMAIPIYYINSILEEFAASNDRKVLDKLVAEGEIKQTWDLEMPLILSKL